MRVRFSLFTKILFWLFLNLLMVSAVIIIFFNLQFRFAPDSPLLAGVGNRLETVARMITEEMHLSAETDRAAILQRYSNHYKVLFLLYAGNGEKLSGPETVLPPEVLNRIVMGPPFRRGLGAAGRQEGPEGGHGPDERMPRKGQRGESLRPDPGMELPPWEQRLLLSATPRPLPFWTLRTAGPVRYWAGMRVQNYSSTRFERMPATLLAVSDSIFGHGLFLDPTPWLLVVATVLVLSFLLWLPFVRSLTVSVKQMTAAAEQIAEERFDVRVNEKRSDEIGRLGTAINHLALRLSGFVGGQKRFLGDISHELNSPLARMQFALSILEERADPSHLSYIVDAQEEVQLMSQLVGELLAFAKAGMKVTDIHLVQVPLRPLVERVCAREAANCAVTLAIHETAAVLAHPQLLARALANVLRNAARYAPGPLTIAAEPDGDSHVRLTVSDQGPGVPADALDRLFDPFYRIEPDRARATGGSGLGLAIVKTCVEACGGTVAAHNISPSGLEISLLLRAHT